MNRLRSTLRRCTLGVLGAVLFAGSAHALPPTVSKVIATDVTTRSFSVAWKSDVPANPTVNVFDFDGINCGAAAAGVTAIAFPTSSGDLNVINNARQAGVMQVRLMGLLPDTGYCFQTVTDNVATAEQTVFPLTPTPIHSVVTALLTRLDHLVAGGPAYFANDVVASTAADIPVGAASGALLLASVPGAIGPVSGYAGDGSAAGDALLDLSNLFSNATGESLNLVGGEIINLTEFRGNGACSLTHFRKVVVDNESVQVVGPGVCFNTSDFNCDNAVGLSDLVLFADEFGANPAVCINLDYDLNTNNAIDLSDLVLFADQFGNSAP